MIDTFLLRDPDFVSAFHGVCLSRGHDYCDDTSGRDTVNRFLADAWAGPEVLSTDRRCVAGDRKVSGCMSAEAGVAH